MICLRSVLGIASLVILLITTPAAAQLAPNAPSDRPQGFDRQDSIDKMRAATAPYVERGRRSYPSAKERFLRGLPPGETFFVLTRLTDLKKRTEDVFVRVQRIDGERIYGLISSRILLVDGFRPGQPYSLQEEALLDWMIAKPDGTEEGNVVGRFLDSYHP